MEGNISFSTFLRNFFRQNFLLIYIEHPNLLAITDQKIAGNFDEQNLTWQF